MKDASISHPAGKSHNLPILVITNKIFIVTLSYLPPLFESHSIVASENIKREERATPTKRQKNALLSRSPLKITESMRESAFPHVPLQVPANIGVTTSQAKIWS